VDLEGSERSGLRSDEVVEAGGLEADGSGGPGKKRRF